ncbi:hypothetical protein SLEP1_g39373 [Rubroshorea leprosula]|uniref:Uncharacterized protein n=1 Tax=Rubroshorea leprosula TaxID=152421 RepID=A0AAV5L0E0_9ROSI|nr:hypothetical protein SLEP1_g39373 [Rubroshorea leprosula]
MWGILPHIPIPLPKENRNPCKGSKDSVLVMLYGT